MFSFYKIISRTLKLFNLQTLISHKWTNLAASDKIEIRTHLTQSLLNQHTTVPHYIRNKLAKLIVDIGRNDWPHFYPDFFSNILQVCQQEEIKCMHCGYFSYGKTCTNHLVARSNLYLK